MSWLEFGFFSLYFSLPIVFALFLLFEQNTRGTGKAHTAAQIFFGLEALIGLFTCLFLQTGSSAFLDLQLPVPASYFSISVVFSPARVLWSMASAATLFVFLFAYKEKISQGNGLTLRLLYLAGFHLFSSFAIFSEKVFPAVMFSEAAIFLLHAHSLIEGGKESAHSRVSYFRRNAFVVLALLIMILLEISGLFDLNAIALFGLILYSLSLVFSRHASLDWFRMNETVLHFLLAAYFLWMGLGLLKTFDLSFAIAGLIFFFSIATIFLSLYRLEARSAVFWLLQSTILSILAVQIATNDGQDMGWVIQLALFVPASLCFVKTIDIFLQTEHRGWLLFASALVLFVYQQLLSGVILGSPIAALQLAESHALELGALFCFNLFLIAVALGKIVQKIKETSGKQKLLTKDIVLPAAGGVLLLSGTVILVFFSGSFDDYTNFFHGLSGGAWLPWVAPLVSILGFGVGYLLYGQKKFLHGLSTRQAASDSLSLRIDPTVLRLNESLANGPTLWSDRIVYRTNEFLVRVGVKTSHGEQNFFGSWLWQELSKLLDSLSYLTRYFQGGSMGAYYVLALLVIIVSCILFLGAH